MGIAEPKQWKKPWGELLRLVMLGVEDWEEIIVVNTSKGGLYVQQLPLTKLRLSHPDLERLSELREFPTWRENWPFCRRKDDPIRMLVDENRHWRVPACSSGAGSNLERNSEHGLRGGISEGIR